MRGWGVWGLSVERIAMCTAVCVRLRAQGLVFLGGVRDLGGVEASSAGTVVLSGGGRRSHTYAIDVSYLRP
jgi:hypothetical protein